MVPGGFDPTAPTAWQLGYYEASESMPKRDISGFDNPVEWNQYSDGFDSATVALAQVGLTAIQNLTEESSD